MSKMKKIFKLGSSKKHVDPSEWTKSDDKMVAAIQADDLEKVDQLMFKKGISPTKLNTQGLTALHIAAIEGRSDILCLFQEKDVDLTTLDFYGKTALLCACKGGHVEIIKYLLQMNPETLSYADHNNLSPLHHACLGGSMEAIRHLVQAGASVSAKDKVGRSPLFIGARLGNLELCKYLLDSGGDINHRDFDKMTALMFAVEYQHTQVVEYLVRRGANVQLVDSGGRDAASYAKQAENDEILKLLENAPSRASWNTANRSRPHKNKRHAFWENIKEEIKEEVFEATVYDEVDVVRTFEFVEDEPSPPQPAAGPVAPARKQKQAPSPSAAGRSTLSPPPGFGSPFKDQTADQKYEEGVVPLDEALESDAAVLNNSDVSIRTSQHSDHFQPYMQHSDGSDSPRFSREALAAVEAIMQSTSSTPPSGYTSETQDDGPRRKPDIDVDAYKELEEEHEFLNRELQQVSVEKKQLEEKVQILEQRLSSSDSEGLTSPMTGHVQLEEVHLRRAQDKEKIGELEQNVQQLHKQIDFDSKPEAERSADDSWNDSDDDLFESEIDKKKSTSGTTDLTVVSSLRSKVIGLEQEIEELKAQPMIVETTRTTVLSESVADKELESLTQYSMLQQAHDSECQQLQTRIEELLDENFLVKKELAETMEDKADLTAAIADVDMKVEDAAHSKAYVRQELDYVHGVIDEMQNNSEILVDLDRIKGSIESARSRVGSTSTSQDDNSVGELRYERDQLKQSLDNAKRETEKVNSEFHEILSQVEGLECLASYNTDLTNENDSLKKEIERLESMGNSSPRHADQKAMALLTMKLQQENNDLKSDNRSLSSRISEIEMSLKETIAKKGQDRLNGSPIEKEKLAMKNEIESLQDTIELLKTESDVPVADWKSQITHLKKTVSQQDETIMELMQQSTSDAQLRYDYEQLQTESEMMATKMQEFQLLFTGQGEASSRQIKILQDQIQSLLDENSNLKAVPQSELSTFSTDGTKSLESKVTSLNGKLKKLDDENQQLEAQLSQAELEMLKLRKDAEKVILLKRKNDALEKESLAMEIQAAQIATINIDGETLNKRVADLERENTEFVDRTSILETEIITLIQDKDILTKERDELAEDIPTLRDELNKLEAHRSITSGMEKALENLHQRNTSLMRDNDTLSKKVYELEARSNNNESDYFDQQAKIKTLTEQLEREQSATVMAILDGHTAEQKTTESNLKEQLLSLERDNDTLRMQIKKHQAEHQNGTTEELARDPSEITLQSISPVTSTPKRTLSNSLKRRSEEFRFKEMEEENDRLKTETERMKERVHSDERLEEMTKQLSIMQEKLELMEKRHHDVVTTYRSHLLRAVRGHMNTEVQQALMHIIKIRQAPEVDV